MLQAGAVNPPISETECRADKSGAQSHYGTAGEPSDERSKITDADDCPEKTNADYRAVDRDHSEEEGEEKQAFCCRLAIDYLLKRPAARYQEGSDYDHAYRLEQDQGIAD